jgi:uncharacterized protein YegL
MDTHAIQGSNFGFSAKRIDDLGATEYTLVGIAADTSGSVSPFRNEIEKCVKEVVSSCRQSPRADNLMMRFISFDDTLEEIHGFRPLSECNLDDYNGCIQIGGMTALYDAACNLTDSVTNYGRSLSSNDFSVNGIIFVITDGMDNKSAMTPTEVKKALGRAVQSEALESVISILIGVNVSDPQVSQYLKDLHQSAGFTQYIELGTASASALAKLADFVSRSISAQSQALGTGGPSQSLSF